MCNLSLFIFTIPVFFAVNRYLSLTVYMYFKFALLSRNDSRSNLLEGKEERWQKLYTFNPIALRKAKIVDNFGLSECSRVKFIYY